MKRTLIAALAGTALAGPAPAAGASLRCEGRLVQPGDTQAEVVLRCGEPFSARPVAIETEGEEAAASEAIVERWTYRLGDGRLVKILTFVGGVLESIDNGQRE